MNYAYLKFKIKNSCKEIFRSASVRRCISFVLYLYARFVAITTKWEVLGVDDFVKNTKDSSAIIVGWHSRAVMMPFFWKKYMKLRLSALVSPHNDGQIIANFLKLFNINPVNGSTNEQARKGALELMRELNDGANLFIAPDGPRGPRMRMKKSPVFFAQKSGKPIYCVAFSSSNAFIVEKAWDKTMIPLPFAKGVLQISDPIFVPENLTDEEFEAYRKKVEDVAIKQLADCDNIVGRNCCQPAELTDYKRKENE